MLATPKTIFILTGWLGMLWGGGGGVCWGQVGAGGAPMRWGEEATHALGEVGVSAWLFCYAILQSHRPARMAPRGGTHSPCPIPPPLPACARRCM